MYFVLPNLTASALRPGFDTVQVDLSPFITSTPPLTKGFDDDDTSRFFHSWDMTLQCQQKQRQLAEPISLHISALGGPRVRRWSLHTAQVDVAIDGVLDDGRPLLLPRLQAKQAKEPWPLTDRKALKVTGPSGLLLWHPTEDSPLKSYEHLLLHHSLKIMLRLRLVNEEATAWRDCLLSFRFAPGLMRLQPTFSAAASPLSSPGLETPPLSHSPSSSESDVSMQSCDSDCC